MLFFQRHCFAGKSGHDAVSTRLADLMRIAHKEYLTQVASGNMTLHVFARCFCAGHRHIRSMFASTRNVHEEALCIVEMLLMERTDLVTEFFCKQGLSDNDLDWLVSMVCGGHRLSPQMGQPVSCIDDDAWGMVADCINRSRMFLKEITPEIARGLFACTLREPLVANSLPDICCLFDAMRGAGYISGNWQRQLQDHGAICNRKGSVITASNYSTTLSRAKKDSNIKKNAIDSLMAQLSAKRHS